jgi:predicted nucleotidyltransferase
MGAYMKIGAVIAEFNPFHNGHKYVADKIKSENDGAIAVMSGNFVQRGDIAVFDKFTRAKAAVLSGIDLVVELPLEYAASNAEIFAYGAVFLLDAMKCVDRLYFGSERGDIHALERASELLLSESAEISEKIKAFLSKGYGLAAAREAAFFGIIDGEILSKPNNVLAIEYIKTLKSIKSDIIPHTFSRLNTEHDSKKANGGYASASLIRKMLSEGENISDFIPAECKNIFSSSPMSDKHSLDIMLLYTLRRFGLESLSNINDVSEGIENRIYKYARTENSIDAIVDKVCTKRYSRARIRRILISAVLGLEKTKKTSPRYIRVLAMNKKGAEILSVMKKKMLSPHNNKSGRLQEYACKGGYGDRYIFNRRPTPLRERIYLLCFY